MARHSTTHRRHARCSPEAVWAVLSDHRAMATWTPLRAARLDAVGSPEVDGVGAVRVLSLAGPPLRERVTAFEPPHRMAYELLAGLPVRDYTGEVELTPTTDGGTDVAWTVALTPRVPGVGRVVDLAIGRMATALVRTAETRAASAA